MYRWVLAFSRILAVAGGVMLCALVMLVVLSVIGRESAAFLAGDFMQTHAEGLADWLLSLRAPGPFGDLRIGPVTGDYELVEAGMAFAIFAFLPLTQLTSGHAVVDLFTRFLPPRVERVLIMLAEVVFALVLIVIVAQLFEGLAAKFKRGQTTFLLQMPIWWAYAASFFGAVSAALVGVYVAAARLWEILTGAVILPRVEGAEV
ncbi:MAG: C4-dicarboxylate ABC transporter permease [Rhodobacterales bacterium]|nr:MAG: C4-dicarboxylate ABC transporter permease [Rhodobacterales bacterium]